MFKILLVDDDRLFSQGLKFLLDELRDDIVIYDAEKIDSVLDLPDSNTIHLVIVDYFFRNSKLQGLQGVKTLKSHFKNAMVVVLSGADMENDASSGVNIDDLRANGASGFISKSANQNILINALTLILDGEEFYPASMLESSKFHRSNQVDSAQLARLTPRQIEILNLAVQGLQNKLIADQLCLAEGTVKAHLSTIYQLLGVKNRTQAANIINKT